MYLVETFFIYLHNRTRLDGCSIKSLIFFLNVSFDVEFLAIAQCVRDLVERNYSETDR